MTETRLIGGRVARWTSAVCFLLVFWPTMHWLWQRWTMSIWYNGHGMFIPLVVGYLGYLCFKEDPGKGGVRSSPWGFLFLIPGLLMVVIDSGIKTQLLSAIGFVLTIIGLVFLLLGAQRAKALGFPMVLLFFMLPIPTALVDRLVLMLRVVSAAGCEHLATWTGLPVLRESTTLHLPNSSLEIADACSGFSTLYASVTMALILAYLTRSTARRLAVLISAVPVAIGCNILRCALLAHLVNYRGLDVLETPLHPMTGIAAFSLALTILFMLSWLGDSKRAPSGSTVQTVSAAHLDRTAGDADSRHSSLIP